jgi:hypothetical protein
MSMNWLEGLHQQILDVPPSLGITCAARVAVGEIIHQCQLGPPGQYRAEIHLL